MYFFDPMYFIFIAPALLLGMWAQYSLRHNFAKANRMAARLTGAAAARAILDDAGLHHVPIEQVPGRLSDHYDPRAKVVRLSGDVYHGRTLAAVGIAAHEVGHAMQDAHNYAPLVIRNLAVPMAGIGSNFGLAMAMLGLIFSFKPLMLVGIVLFAGVVFFQVINLPVEFNASTRAKQQLAGMGIVDSQDMPYVRKVLTAAALTYVAATMQAILTLLYLISRMNRR